MSELTQQQANKLVSEKVKDAQALIQEAKDISDKYSLYFNFNIDPNQLPYNVSRCIGGTYEGKGVDMQGTEEWTSSDCYEYETSKGSWRAWKSSSEEC